MSVIAKSSVFSYWQPPAAVWEQFTGWLNDPASPSVWEVLSEQGRRGVIAPPLPPAAPGAFEPGTMEMVAGEPVEKLIERHSEAFRQYQAAGPQFAYFEATPLGEALGVDPSGPISLPSLNLTTIALAGAAVLGVGLLLRK